MSTGLESKIKFDFNQPKFQQQFGSKTGTLSEKRQEKAGNDKTAEIINASANGVDSLANVLSLFMGGGKSSQEQHYAAPPPPPKNKNLPILLGGGAILILLLIFLITSSNGQAKK